jgi:hypothetical protein
MLNDFNWGGYLLYRLYPQSLVFLDSQTDFYGEPFIREYDSLIGAQKGWQNILNKYNIHWAILSTHSPIGLHLQKELHWTILYQDSTAIILRTP